MDPNPNTRPDSVPVSVKTENQRKCFDAAPLKKTTPCPDATQAEFIGILKIRFRFPAILMQFLVWGQACKLCLKMRFPPNQHFQNRGLERELHFKKCSRGQN
jgi:hypothetical protein